MVRSSRTSQSVHHFRKIKKHISHQMHPYDKKIWVTATSLGTKKHQVLACCCENGAGCMGCCPDASACNKRTELHSSVNMQENTRVQENPEGHVGMSMSKEHDKYIEQQLNKYPWSSYALSFFHNARRHG